MMAPKFGDELDRPNNRPTDDIEVDEIVCALLRAVRAFVDTMPTCAWRRAIDAVVRKLELEVARWRAVPPSREQRQAMVDLVTELEAEVRGGVNVRRPISR